MDIRRNYTPNPDCPDRLSPMRFIINWIVETDRRFRRTQDQIDRMSDRF